MLAAFFSAATQAQEVVLAFTDTLGPSTSLDGTARSKMLIRNMARADVKQAMFLIKTKRVNANTIDRLDFYDETGQLLVNAGHNFSVVHRQKSFGYPIDIMKANGILESFANYHKHVNFPYLYGNSDPEILSQLENFLAEHNYLPTYVTTRVHDEYMNHLYQLRIGSGRTVDIRALEKAYVNMIVKAVTHYDAKAHMMLGFSPRQVLLLHENDLAAYCIVGVIDELNKRGFKIVAPEKVFTDPISNPYFISGFSATSYMPYVTGLPEEKPIWYEDASTKDKDEIHGYLREQGLDGLLPQ
ncbi:hypothetical protein GCM10011613_02080 [Cellvibrio zantedeschiae]|uniref:Uncharacterized protein n=2 Tax=Cellvibrio zantedeschiae TaxID=1237077 RepID=A0ABQ3AS30_9GAMM|nr:hypothetical protein GCM10011613_02080 [Cellvibrio zantedeschiae]